MALIQDIAASRPYGGTSLMRSRNALGPFSRVPPPLALLDEASQEAFSFVLIHYHVRGVCEEQSLLELEGVGHQAAVQSTGSPMLSL
eukprot:CAMPEP_0180142620 /NCGR_PEP_ID=MMETSP0986-20121125/15696_1 /TAXON_ID=697907 /ORGANISM="non described non described, Strain CCMP2293" /LENGTH=86 /DNA_ID=CAMNT_0022085867 /DNA_START=414 /DNA_END=672 /DNA_ORIENTATION=-